MKVFILEDSYSRVQLFEEVFGRQAIYHREHVNQAIELYQKAGPFDLILLDHDLEPHFQTETEFDTGFTFAKFLAEQPPTCQVIIHSYNPDGAARMHKLLEGAGWNVVRMPFGLKLLDLLRATYGENIRN